MTPDKLELPPGNVTNAQLYVLLQQLNTKQSLIAQENVAISRKLTALEADTADMVATWKAGGAVLRIVRWGALVGGAFLGVWKLFRGGA